MLVLDIIPGPGLHIRRGVGETLPSPGLYVRRGFGDTAPAGIQRNQPIWILGSAEKVP